MIRRSDVQSERFYDTIALLAVVSGKFLLHVGVNFSGGYGYFRDEFYYLACADHLAWGYVDHPPLSIGLLWLSRTFLGDSLPALRLLPAIAGALVVWWTGLIACEFGGRRFAQVLAALAVSIAPLFLAIHGFYSMNSFDHLFWVLSVYILARLIKTHNPRWWLLLGFVLGLGLLNKISMLWFGFGLTIGLLLTPLRRYFLTKWPWIAAAIAFMLFLPHVLWQIAYDWPTLEFMQRAASLKMVLKSPLEFFGGQILGMHPFTLPIWLSGLYAYFGFKPLRRFQIFGWIYIAVFLFLFFNGASRDYYLAPAYPMLFAAGAIVIEQLTRYRRRPWLKPLSLILLLIGGLITLPLVLPVLPVETYIRYQAKLGIAPSSEEKTALGQLPQHYADRYGWPEMAAAVARVYQSLSPQEQAICGIFIENYGEAGAIDFFGTQYGLPRAISGHNNYWLWGPGEASGEVMIHVGGNLTQLQQIYTDVRQAAVFTCEYCMPYENNLPIYIGRGLRQPLDEIWPLAKNYI
ncbi:glycosyl transferase family protein [Candidatus Vecturithrix granuli]|uniref:Glycosyl transferase family protein n=1 Tax=Vecturithrix granuli TaxID=1499967 RepID=A0A081CAV8_VECG1|nr:glycosyl transferase family protein [Candidatus Vecturithrix granuli]